MIQVFRYRQSDCPEPVRSQIIQLMKLEWPSTFHPGRADWPSEAIELNPVSIILTIQGAVVSHASVLRTSVRHVGNHYLAFGVAAMVTAMKYRQKGFARRVFEDATQYMMQEGADIGVFTCDESLRMFYEWNGWNVSRDSPLIGGTREKPFRSDVLGKVTLIQLFSERAKANHQAITSSPIHIALGEGKLW